MMADPSDSYVSLGAGVQSSAMLLMLDAGDLRPRPVGALFADTGWEPAAVYRNLAYLESVCTIPITRVSAGNLRDQLMAHARGEGRFASPPLHVAGEGMLRRQCTREFKIEPMLAELRRRGYGPKRPVTQMLGISVDEVERASPSRVRWAVSSWPLLDAGISRADCLVWLDRHGHPRPPKSSCIGCPLHGSAQWRALDPADLADAVAVDLAIRHLPRMESATFLHRERRPLSEVNLGHDQLDLFGDECAGVCGV
jgi:hypothetical protein